MSEIQKCKERRIPNKRKWLTLEKKLDIIRCHENGASYAKIARANGMNEASVRTIIKKKEQYKEQGLNTTSYMSKVITRQRSTLLNNMERLLLTWIEECNQMKIPLNQTIIQQKAITIYNSLKENGENEEGVTNEKFTASRGWYFRFKNRMRFRNARLANETGNSDKDISEQFINTLKKIIIAGGYRDEQIFKVDETGLYWKRMPSKTFLAENEKSQPGYKPSQDRLTLLLGGNAYGDMKLNPLIVYRAENPRDLKSYAESSLPVIWRSNNKALITEELFKEWFLTYFCPTVEAYCKDSGIDFKILLFLTNASNYSPDILNLNQNVTIHYLSQNINALMQSVEQVPIPIFKAHYLKIIFSQAIEASIGAGSSSLQKFWKNYNIRNAIENICASWLEITNGCMQSAWLQVLPHLEYETINFDSHSKIAEDIVRMGKELGFESMDISNVIECLHSHCVDVEDKGVQIKVEKENEQSEVQSMQAEFPSEELERIMQGVDMACKAIASADPNINRANVIQEILQSSIQCYKDLYVEKKKTSLSNLM